MKFCLCLFVVFVEFFEYLEEGGCFVVVKFILRWILFILSFLFMCVFIWIILDCSEVYNWKYFFVLFLMFILWIVILSFGMVILVGWLGCILSVDKFIMVLVVIVIGISVLVSFYYLIVRIFF